MQNELSIHKMIWAIDPFESDKDFHRTSAGAIRVFQQYPQVKIYPVYVLSAAQLNLSSSASHAWMHYYRPAAEKALNDLVEDLGLTDIEKPRVLLQATHSSSEASDILSEHALSLGADLIITRTHGRKGIKRFLLGSFAETMLLHSKTPLFVLNAKIQKFRPLDILLFPTDFGKYSEFIFRRIVRFASSIQSKLILFHSVLHPVEPLLQSGVYLLGGTWVPIQSYFSYEVERQTRRAEAWGRWATHQGVPTKVVIHSTGGPVENEIQAEARRKKVSCIIMEAQSNAIEATLIGSITRQVIRSATCPVWILRHSMFEGTFEKRKPTEIKHKAA